jgi:hypothetical protein
MPALFFRRLTFRDCRARNRIIVHPWKLPAPNLLEMWASGLLSERGEGNYGLGGRSDGDVDRALGEVASAQIALHAAAPRADESEVQCAADYRAGDRDEASDPFFGDLLTQLCRQAFGDARRKFFDHLFFRELLAEIDSGGGSSGEPELAALIAALRFKSVKQTEALDEAQGDDGEKTCVGDQRDHSAESESCAFGKSETLRVVNKAQGDVVEPFDRYFVHAAEVGNVKAMLAGKVVTEIFGIDFDGAKSLEKTKAQKAPERRAVSGSV